MSEETQPPTTRAGSSYQGHLIGHAITFQLQDVIDGGRFHLESYPTEVSLWLDNGQLTRIGTAIADHLGMIMVRANGDKRKPE
jgi:hypothetical protein